jgi:hypothetical protein
MRSNESWLALYENIILDLAHGYIGPDHDDDDEDNDDDDFSPRASSANISGDAQAVVAPRPQSENLNPARNRDDHQNDEKEEKDQKEDR